MEIKDGRVKPTTPKEVEVFSRLLREQELANYRSPANATPILEGVELAGRDSYKLFCAAERRVHKAMAGDAEAQVIGSLVLGLAKDAIQRINIDGLSPDFFTSREAIEPERIASLISLAGQALINRYD